MPENGVRFPRFFKVFLSETASESLSIPLSFKEHLAVPLPPTAKLQGISGRTWTVSMTMIREAVYFTTGWSSFAEEHNIKSREFLTFVYDGCRTFEVSVYGRSSCKEIRGVPQVVDLSDSEEEEETSLAFSEGNSDLDVMANPCFDTTVRTRILELLIPAHVIQEHNLIFENTINYIDAEGTTTGKKRKWADGRVCFNEWGKICRRNRLNLQDTVTCELLHTRNKVHSIRIHITP